MKRISISDKLSLTSILGSCLFIVSIFGLMYLMLEMCLDSFYAHFNLSDEQIAEYFVFNLDDPNIISAFLSNYIHKNPEHLCGNVSFTILYTLGIILVYLIREWMKIPVRKPYLFVFLGCSLFILPFFVSGVSYIFRAFLDSQCGGFSGVTFAFLGALLSLFIPLIAKLLSDFSKQNEKNLTPQKCWTCAVFGMAGIAFICIFSSTLTDMQNPGTNYFAHVTGFIFGFALTYLYDTYRIRKEKLLN